MESAAPAPAVRFGIARIDGPLGGGVGRGILADVYGPPASGKTQLVYQACVGAAAAGRNVLFVDARGEFRPERVLEMARALRAKDASSGGSAGGTGGTGKAEAESGPARPEDLLDRISVRRATTAGAQERAVGSIDGFDLVVVDGATDLFTSEHDALRRHRPPGAPHWTGRHRRFAEYARALSRRASECGAAVIMTNTVRSAADGRQVESLGEAVSLFAHARMRLEPGVGPGMKWTAGELATLGATSRFAFEITAAGVSERDPRLACRGGPGGAGTAAAAVPQDGSL